MFVEKYSPKKFGDIIGQGKIIDFIKNWVNDWNNGKKRKPLLFHGGPGVGKTSLTQVIAIEMNWDIFEMNASDSRTKAVIEKVAGGAALNSSFNGKLRLVLMDEVDGLQGRKDKGGVSAIAKLIKLSSQPIILTANKIYSANRKLDSIKFLCDEIKFSKVNSASIAKRLREICELEGIDYDQEVLKALAVSCEGDMRACLMDLQNLSLLHNKITLEDVKSSGYRERLEDVFNVITPIFKSKNIKEIRRLKAYSDVDSDLLKKWVEENIPRVYSKGNDLQRAFERLSRADIFDGRIQRTQNYGFLRYSTELATSAVALAKEHEYPGWIQLQFPTLLKKLSASKGERAMRKTIAEKIGKQLHSSKHRFFSADYPFLKELFKDKELAANFTARFELDDKELAYILGTKPETKKVKTLMESVFEIKKKGIIEKSIRHSSPTLFSPMPMKEEKIEKEVKPISVEEEQTSLFTHFK